MLCFSSHGLAAGGKAKEDFDMTQGHSYTVCMLAATLLVG